MFILSTSRNNAGQVFLSDKVLCFISGIKKNKQKKTCIAFKVFVVISPWIFLLWYPILHMVGFPDGSDNEESACNTGDLGSIPRQGWSPGEENDYPLWYSCLENSMDRGAWQATVHGITKSWTRLSTFTLSFIIYSMMPGTQHPWSSYIAPTIFYIT